MEKKTITRSIRITKKKLLVKQIYSKGNISITRIKGRLKDISGKIIYIHNKQLRDKKKKRCKM